MAELYWIHLPEHTDMFSEGYVGITKHTALQRFKGHKKAANHTKRNTSSPIYNAIRKYGEKLIVSTLVISTWDYVLNLESKMRPTPKVGWNILSGGEFYQRGQGFKHKPEDIAKMCILKRELHSAPEFRSALVDRFLSKELPDLSYLDADGAPFKFWATRYKLGACPPLWRNIPELWGMFNKNPKLLSLDAIRLSSFYIESNEGWVRKILRYFRSGWNPMSDLLYLEDFQIGI